MEKQHSVRELVAKLAYGETHEMLDAAEALGRQGESAVLTVAPLLGSFHRETRWRGAIALERIGPPAVEVLMVAAGDGDWEARLPAIWALEQIGGQRSVPTLVENLNGKDERRCWRAASAISKIGADRGLAIMEATFAGDPAESLIDEEPVEAF